MPAITVTDADVRAEHERRHGPDVDLDPATARTIRRDLAQAQVDARTPPAEPSAEKGPDHLTVTVEITHGDRVLGVTQQHVNIPTT
ncbi:hypothetical protein [Nocardioides nanhaiensis]|uniref:Uncharacterized protein n=1 Tax=Nocardioides nanhaiensis TaxID=1476871 RepID=A0ABP8W4J7_9ACTN